MPSRQQPLEARHCRIFLHHAAADEESHLETFDQSGILDWGGNGILRACDMNSCQQRETGYTVKVRGICL